MQAKVIALSLLIAGIFVGQSADAQIPPVKYAPPTWVIPPHIKDGGDRDFHGKVNIYLNVHLYIHQQARHEVWACVKIYAVEPKGDKTRAFGTQHIKVATFARPVSCIVTPKCLPIPSGQRWAYGYVDTDCQIDIETNPCACGLINKATFVGDTNGNEAGSRTGVRLEFKPILVSWFSGNWNLV